MSLGAFYNSIVKNVDDEFMKKFEKFSLTGDRHGMINMLIQLDNVTKLVINISKSKKDQSRAEEYYNNAELIEIKSDKNIILHKIEQLTNALFTVDINSFLCVVIIIARAKCWFTIKSYIKCFKDCDYALCLLNESIDLNSDVINCDKYRKICLGLKNHSFKSINKSHLNSSTIKIPKIEGKINKKLRNASDSVSLIYNEKKGRHLIASKNIKAGSILIVDDPFAFSTDKNALQTNCLHCHISLDLNWTIKIPCNSCQTVFYCSLDCRNESWINYHKYECDIFDHLINDKIGVNQIGNTLERSHLLLTYRMTIEKAINKQFETIDDDFLQYQNAKDENERRQLKIDINNNDFIYQSKDYQTVYSLKTHCEQINPKINLLYSIKSIFLAKCLLFVMSKINPDLNLIVESKELLLLLSIGMLRHIQIINCNAYEIVENIRDENTKTWEPRNVGGAIYSTVSLINHSCYPNIVRHSYPGGKVVVRTLSFIEKGSEILDCYGPHFISDNLPKRHEYLLNKYHFVCSCEACKYDWKFPFSNEITFRCSLCGFPVDAIQSQCLSCHTKINIKKLNDLLEKSMKKRITAVTKMYDNDYQQALPLLLEHNNFVDKNLIVPSLEGIKTQQSMIQCFNSMSNIAVNNY